MSKGLPWVGSGSTKESKRDNYSPWPAEQAPTNAQPVEGNARVIDTIVHESLRGEVHPDKPGTARPG